MKLLNSFSTTIGRQIETIEAKDAFRDLKQCKEGFESPQKISLKGDI